MNHWPDKYVHCLSEELVELLILGEELEKEDRAYLIAHLSTCLQCQEIAGVLAKFYVELFLSEQNGWKSGIQRAS